DLDHPQARSRADRLRGPLATPSPPAAAPTLLGVDDAAQVAGRFRLLRELGRGSAGAVYVAYDAELDRELALKILHPSTVRGTLGARAFTEARLAAAIHHPGVVAIYDLDEERRLVAMELCTGGSLRERLRRGPLGPDDARR